ncbi:MAG: MBL fold metallo-hydrolase [Bacteroides sp.]|nr:MBL fold metallo-hydrolase [Bacteroidales bacterium]MBD5224153.1 MBL fold metallo-hydrolase [Bacteroidales bacterium]MBD5302809.1 MBL fold metallo-hydrolase [Bacteroides sp.]MBD5304874.1 MBL fold metallo-hydrolase [Bacteroides sp.]MBD5348056.1 MBL fold metallo-hydrolase [Bacteroides sp.]
MIKELMVEGVFAENTYFYIDSHSKAGFIIDPGAQAGLIYDTVMQNGWHIERILLTHGHFDHFGAAEILREKLAAPIFIYHEESRYLTDTALNLSGNTMQPIVVKHYEELSDGEIIRLRHNSGFYLKVIHTPGHTPGSVTYYSPEEKAAFVGDLFYQHGPGLTNFPGGNRNVLENTIINKIFTLPDDTLLLSGHSSPITIGEEKSLLLR